MPECQVSDSTGLIRPYSFDENAGSGVSSLAAWVNAAQPMRTMPRFSACKKPRIEPGQDRRIPTGIERRDGDDRYHSDIAVPVVSYGACAASSWGCGSLPSSRFFEFLISTPKSSDSKYNEGIKNSVIIVAKTIPKLIEMAIGITNSA